MMNEEKFAKRLSLITKLLKAGHIDHEESTLLLEYEKVEEKVVDTITNEFIEKYKDYIKTAQKQHSANPFKTNIQEYNYNSGLSILGNNTTINNTQNLSNSLSHYLSSKTGIAIRETQNIIATDFIV